jgi:hypothetical protein
MRGTRSPHARNRDATSEQIHQLFAAQLPEVEPADGWYGEPGGIADYRQDICREATRYAREEADYACVMRQYLSLLDGISASAKPDAPKVSAAA